MQNIEDIVEFLTGIGFSDKQAYSMMVEYLDAHQAHDEETYQEAMLLDFIQALNKERFKELLWEACATGDLLTVCVCVDHVSPNLFKTGTTPLHEALQFPGIVYALLEAKADPNKSNAQGVSPLKHCNDCGLTDSALLLLAFGATP